MLVFAVMLGRLDAKLPPGPRPAKARASNDHGRNVDVGLTASVAALPRKTIKAAKRAELYPPLCTGLERLRWAIRT
jgi:hypothetical protein